MRIIITLVLVLGLFIGGIAYIVFSEPEVSEQTLHDAETALARDNHNQAIRLVQRYISRYPDDPRGHMVAGNIYIKLNEVDKAYEYLTASLTEDNPDPIQTRIICARLATQLARAFESETHLRTVLTEVPDHPGAHAAMFQMLRVQGRNTELRPHFMATIRRKELNLEQVLVMANPELVHVTEDDGEFVQACMAAVPDDPLPMLGQARKHVDGQDVADSVPILEDVVRAHPEILVGHGLLGRALLRVGTTEQLAAWQTGLPDNKDEDADIWYVRGELAARAGDSEGAARCFWEALNRDPIHRSSAYQLGRTLLQLEGQQDAAEKFLQHAIELASLGQVAFEAGPDNPKKMREVYDRMIKLGRIWEAVAWGYAAQQIESEKVWATNELRKVLPQLNAGPPFVLAAANPASTIDLSVYPVPKLGGDTPAKPVPGNSTAGADPGVRFEDQAKQRGIDFTFFTDVSSQARMFEFSGGGAGIVDFDCDGWPDVYLTEGAGWPVNPTQRTLLDRLYRNEGGEQFSDVSPLAMDADNAYSQGVAVGDVNGDGFPDIFVANIGPNALYLNNGDGTFEKAALAPAIAGNEWTTGAAIIDLNGDGAPEVYTANYVGGDDVFTTESRIGARLVQPKPTQFAAEPDRLLLNDEEGGFRDATTDMKIEAPGGKGLAMVAFRRDSDSPEIFVANDMRPNHLFRPLNAHFSEGGVVSGVAVSGDGAPLSSHSIAAGDINGDGRIDLFVGNLSAEPNNLYISRDQMVFEDRIGESGLREPGFATMAWGAQFLDGDLDGDLDLLVANGDLEDRVDEQEAKMPTQYFDNDGEGRFSLAPAKPVSPYFEKLWFGRAVARVDWNRDGLPDAVVTHRSAPVALLTNTTPEHGDSIRVQLAGRSGARDCAGAIVRLKTDKRTLTRFVTSGDGFQASNQKLILFGVAADETIESLEVSWHSRTESTVVTDVARNVDLILVEGADSLMEIPR